MPPAAAEPPAPGPPRGARAGWLLGALVFMVSTGLPWTSCRNLSPIQLAIHWSLSRAAKDHFWALGLALPLLLLTAVASMETRGRPYPSPRRTVIVAALIAVTSVAINLVWNDFALLEWQHVVFRMQRGNAVRAGGVPVLPALRALLFAPPLAVATWALARRGNNAEPLAARWIAAHAAFALPVAWAGHLDRAGATLAFVASSVLLVLSIAVRDTPSPIDERTRKRLYALTAALIVATTLVVFNGVRPPRFLGWPLPPF